MDLTTPKGVAEHMKQSTNNEDDWDRRIEEVKQANNGNYPSFWYATVIASGIHNQVRPNSGINISTLDDEGNWHDEGTFDPVTGKLIS